MKNITIAVDDEIYRNARVAAARCATSVSALVKKFLLSLTTGSPAPGERNQELESLLKEITNRHPGFSCRDNLSRDALHERH